MNKNRPLQFTQLAGGALFHDVQAKFQKAQAECLMEKVSAKLTLEIAIAPPSNDDPTGAVGYSVHFTMGKKKARVLNTLVNRETGLIYADGLSDPRQVAMFEDQFQQEGTVDVETGEVLPAPGKTTFQPRREET